MFKKPTGNSIKSAAIDVLSATGGGMLSNGVVTLIPDTIKKENEEIVRGGIAITAAVAAAAVKGNTAKAKAAKMFLAGMSIAQIFKTLPKIASKLKISAPTSESSATDEFFAAVFGLGCPCTSAPSTTLLPMQVPALNAGSFDYQGTRAENYGIRRGQHVAPNAFR